MTDFSKIKRSCNLCGTMMTGGYEGFIAHGAEHHPNHSMTGSPDNPGTKCKFVEKRYLCALDETWHSDRRYLARSIKAHGWTNERYFTTYGCTHMPEEWAENTQDPKYGDAQATPTCLHCSKTVRFTEQKWHYPKFCGFSCSTSWHAIHTDRVAQAQKTIDARRAADPTYFLTPNMTAYWTARGLTEDEARAKVSERQGVGGLDRYIERHGEEEGRRRHAERQAKWLASMSASGMFKGISRVSLEMFEAIEAIVPGIVYGENEVVVRLPTRSVRVDCIDRDNKKVIEFYGDYWHGNPAIYSETAVIQKQMTAKEKWEKDKVRNESLIAAGYDLLIVWESDYKDDPNAIIERCVDFLHSRKEVCSKQSL